MKKCLGFAFVLMLTFSLVACSDGSGSSALVGRWLLEPGQPTRDNPEDMELLKDGTGIVDKAGINWKVENGRFYLTHPLAAMSFEYKKSGATLILTKDDGESLRYKQESDSKNRGGSRITEKNLVGIWELEDVANISRREVSDRDEFFKDGTGISSQGNNHVSFTWRLRDGNRLQFDQTLLGTEIDDIELSENGSLLTYYLDGEHHKKAMYRKK